MSPESFILTAISVIAAIGSLLSLRSNNKRVDSEARNIEDTITERVLARSDKDLAKMQKQLDAEIASRAADKLIYEAEIEKLRTELHTERSARGLLESKLIEAQQRISALEDELDRRERRIKELEGNGGSSPTSRVHGFK